MASKFMAFQGVASTSTASMENNGDAESERIEMNAAQHPNYQTNQSHGMTTDSNPYGAVDEEDDSNENLEEKNEDNVGYRKFIYNNSEQFKPICGGLLLLMGSGIHIVWGIFRVFYLYNCKEKNSFYLRLVIWSWYIGAIIGNCFAGYALVKFRKAHLYFTGGVLLIVSGLFLMFSGNNLNIYLLISRVIGGFTQGLIYVAVVVHASDIATKEFREFLMLIVGAVLNYSILLSVLAFFHTEGLFRTGLMNGLGLITFGVCTILITTKHATETVPFILQNNGSELDALQAVSKLKKKPVAARSVHHDFLTLKNLVQDEMEHYGTPDFRKVLLPENRKSLIFCCYGRLCSVLSFNLPLIVMIMLFLRHWADETNGAQSIPATSQCPDYLSINGSNQNVAVGMDSSINKANIRKRHAEVETNIENVQFKDLPLESDENNVGKSQKSNNTGDLSKPKTEEKMSGRTEKEPNSGVEHNDNTNHKANSSEQKGKTNPELSEGEPKNKKGDEEMSQNVGRQEERTPESNTTSEDEGADKRKTAESNGNKPKDSGGHATKEVSSPTFFAHLIIFLHSRELTLVLLAWFIFGTITAAVLYTFNLKRFIYYISCVLSSILAIAGLAHSFHFISAILHFCLIVYFNYVTIPIDVFGHCMLAEAFPVTLKPFSVASVAMIENLVHIIVITLYLSELFHNSILLLMCSVAFISYEIARNLPQKGNLPLAEAREQYQNIDLMLFNEPKTGYNQQQEFI